MDICFDILTQKHQDAGFGIFLVQLRNLEIVNIFI